MNENNTKNQFSVIIPTYKRYQYAKEVIKMLQKQTHPPLEVIIVDATPVTTHEDISINYDPKWINYIPVDFMGNISRQRNIAIQKSRGNILLFLDDDVEFDTDLLENYNEAFNETGADGICGLILDNGKRRSFEYMRKRRPFLLDPGGINLRYENRIAETTVICTASFACKRKAIVKTGGFDENLYGSIEDVDLGIRLKNAGFTIIHHHKPVLDHLSVQSSGSRSPSLGLIWKNSNFYYFQMKHFYNDNHSSILIKSFYDFLRPSRLWLKPFFIYNHLKVLPEAYRQARYRILDGPKYI